MSDAVTALFAAIHAHNLEGVRLLIEAEPELLNSVSPSGLSPVLFAAYYRRPTIVQLLIDAGAPLTLFEATATGQTARVTDALDAEPDKLNAFSPDGFTPLGLAAFFGHEALVSALLKRGADVHAVSRNVMAVQPLHSAVAGNHLKIVQELVTAGADVNAVQQDGFTPLMGAAQNGNAELVDFLLSQGAALDARTADDRRAWTLAAAENHQEVLKRLRAAGAEPEENDYGSPEVAGADWGMPDDKIDKVQVIGQTGGVTGFDTPDPKDTDPASIYTTTPADDRVSAEQDGSTYQPVEIPDAKEVTGQFDHLATRDPEAMEHRLQRPEFAGAESTLTLGVGTTMLGAVVPTEGVGTALSTGLIDQHIEEAIDPNPNYTPPSKMSPPHINEWVRNLPSDDAAVLEHPERDDEI